MSCGQAPKPANNPSKLEFDVDIDKSELDYKKIRNGFDQLKLILEGQKTPTLTFPELLTIFPIFTGTAKQKVDELVTRRQPEIPLQCHNFNCYGHNQGQYTVIKIPESDITITVYEQFNFKFRLTENDSAVEFCEFNGIYAQKGFFGGNVDGAYIKLGDTEVETIFIDVGLGGSYPTASCKI